MAELVRDVAQIEYGPHVAVLENELTQTQFDSDGIEIPIPGSSIEVNLPTLREYQRIKRNVSLAIQAMKWYRANPDAQYDNNNVLQYDEAARLITDREGFGAFLSRVSGHTGRTLETAAGTGLVSTQMIPNSSEYVATDVSKPALKILRNRIGHQAQVHEADFLNLPFEDSSFDTLICVGGYRYVSPEKRATFWKEAKRVLGEGGRLILTQFHPSGIRISGSGLRPDSPEHQESFSLRDIRKFDSRINIPPVSIKSGSYETFELSVK